MIPPPLRRSWRHPDGRTSTNLLELADGVERLDPRGVSDLLAFGYLGGRRSLVPGVERVPAAWELSRPDPHPEELEADGRADRLWELLVEAVAEAVDGTGHPRTTLSGGLDSRAVAAALAALDREGATAGTFGDPDCADLPVARRAASALGLPHRVTELEPDAALRHEDRVWRATGGQGGPAAAPGADTDMDWSTQCDVLLSGTSGDVIWGDSVRPGPSPARRLRQLGVPYFEPAWDEHVPPAPPSASDAGARAWRNLWTRQAAGTWNGARSRLAVTPVAPVLWSPDLLAFCLALGDDDRQDRALVRRMLARNAEAVGVDRIPLALRTPVHDLDRAMRGEAWTSELDRWLRETDFERVGCRRRGVGRLVGRLRAGRPRSGSVSRVRALTRWTALLGD